MSVPFAKTGFVAGEISPSLFGHVDLAKFTQAASTMRNMFVSYRGGAYSRAGTAFVGFSKQTGRTVPPRLIPFQFSINQGLALEFGNQYMRVISNGAFVTESPIPITGASNANPVVLQTTAFDVTSATPNTGAVTQPYAPGDTITLAGGTTDNPAVLSVTNTRLVSALVDAPGATYAPGDTINLTGGTQSTPAVLTVATTQLATATVDAGGSGGTTGTQTVTGTTGTGVKFQAQVNVAGGAMTAVLGISIPGSYTVNPTSLTAEPVTGGGLTGARLSLVMGVNTVTVSTAGVFTANPVNGQFTQASTSGGGSGATFQTAVLGPNAVTVATPGIYGVKPANPVAQASSSGVGLGATFTVSWTNVAPFKNGDWIFVSGVGGMTQLNGRTFVVQSATPTTVALADVYGNTINGLGYGVYTAGGTASLIYTLSTPYGEADLEYIKFTQSADVMSLACWNQVTGTEYPPQDLKRFADDNWVLAPPQISATISAPGAASGATSSSGTTFYQYVVTAINRADGSESVASPIADIPDSVDIAVTTGQITITWDTVNGASSYNIYKAPASTGADVPTGSLFGFAGQAYGNQFVDANIVSDFSEVPPLHQDPFAPGQIIGGVVVSGGTGLADPGYTITSATGSGAVLELVVVNTALVAILVLNPGQNYRSGDLIAITGGGGATATLTVGPQTGTYPSVVGYYQERRVYASSMNNPDTYWFSQPGAFTNFDARIPTIATDAITGTPWSVEVNGIQFMISMPGGLVVLTGLSAWQLTGVGGSSLNPQPITPANQQAQPQAYNGCSATVPPIKIDYDIIYVQAKGSIVRDLSYNFFVNIYTGADLTELSSQLFTGFTIREWAWCEEPYKVAWAVRSDGTLLSLTYLKPQEVQGWARSDTNGLFQSVCSVTEPPVDALYLAVQRFPGADTAYMIERMDNRIWTAAENCWCVDCGLSLPQPEPQATLTASSASGLGSLTGVTNLIGGKNYSTATTATVVDNNNLGPGTGASPTLTIVSGVITNITFGAGGTGYTFPSIVISDPANTGTGASASAILNNSATFTASAPVFAVGSIGSIIRMGGGIARITAFTDSQHVTANILSPIISTLPNSGGQVQAQPAGSWTMTAPVTLISGLDYLAGATVTGLADGNVIPPTTVSAAGTITLGTAASAVTVGLGFQVQLQSVYLDAGQPTIQGQRKKIAAVTVRAESSRGLKAGTNQLDGSTTSPIQIAPQWSGLTTVPDAIPSLPGIQRTPYNALAPSLYTGDRRVTLSGGFQKPGQVALQQDNPLPMQVLALIPELLPGDTPQTQVHQQQQNRAA